MPLSTARRGALAVLLAALILFVLGSIELARAATHAVTISEFAFSPATLTVTAGDTVTWTNEDPVQAAPATAGGSIPAVAMTVRSSVWPVLLGAVLLLGAFELAFASRRRRG